MGQAVSLPPTGSASYETDESVSRYLLRYWGGADDIWPPEYSAQFPKPEAPDLAARYVDLILKYSSGTGRAIDIGCAAGRASFELARTYEEVVGIDYSHALINAANILKEQGEMAYSVKQSGSDFKDLKAVIDPVIDRSRVSFEQGDGSAIPDHYQGFDAVLFGNVLCRLPDPQVGLERMQAASNALVKPGGTLLISSPFSWLEAYTPREKWIETGKEGLQEILNDFELLHSEDVPMFFREHARKFEYVVPLITVWKRKGG